MLCEMTIELGYHPVDSNLIFSNIEVAVESSPSVFNIFCIGYPPSISAFSAAEGWIGSPFWSFRPRMTTMYAVSCSRAAAVRRWTMVCSPSWALASNSTQCATKTSSSKFHMIVVTSAPSIFQYHTGKRPRRFGTCRKRSQSTCGTHPIELVDSGYLHGVHRT